MHKFGVFTALTLSWITASCAERIVHPAVIPQPTPPKAAPKPWPNNVEARHRAETIAEKAGKRSAIHSRQVTPSASVKPEPSPEPQAPLPQVSQQPEADPNFARTACGCGASAPPGACRTQLPGRSADAATPGTRRADLPLNVASHRVVTLAGACHTDPAGGAPEAGCPRRPSPPSRVSQWPH